eukprot:TRINITY_DN21100_c0_g1_i2.p1 TRINITY_DN21100_c0_g1~~TRINITY_DN21100_c0_g1_i2.p1  ORF type:complete len:140 (-),score=22.27 TRINITY_DN21100_c0_g1_i2:3-362(-)
MRKFIEQNKIQAVPKSTHAILSQNNAKSQLLGSIGKCGFFSVNLSPYYFERHEALSTEFKLSKRKIEKIVQELESASQISLCALNKYNSKKSQCESPGSITNNIFPPLNLFNFPMFEPP